VNEYVTLINLLYWYGKRQPGAISANFHRSLDGERVAVYSRWRGEAALEAALATAGQRAFQERAATLAQATDFRRYEVSGTSED
jgi:quinol monooxygenase YgiN